jgi:hypothetical protein
MNNYVFIVPNRAGPADDSEWGAMWLRDNNETAKKMDLAINGVPVDFKPDDVLVQLWWTGSGSENWSRHSLPSCLNCTKADIERLKAGKYVGNMVEYLPLRLIKDFKEGDTFTVEANGKKVTVICNQKDYRYRDYGNFEEVLKQVTAE